MDGQTFLSQARQDDRIKDVPIVVATAHPSVEAPGASAVLGKPVRPERLLHIWILATPLLPLDLAMLPRWPDCSLLSLPVTNLAWTHLRKAYGIPRYCGAGSAAHPIGQKAFLVRRIA